MKIWLVPIRLAGCMSSACLHCSDHGTMFHGCLEHNLVQILQVQLVCSPDAEVYMLVREPETCHYVVTLYHPSICDIDGYQHRPPAVQEKQMEKLRDMMASVAGRGHEEL